MKADKTIMVTILRAGFVRQGSHIVHPSSGLFIVSMTPTKNRRVIVVLPDGAGSKDQKIASRIKRGIERLHVGGKVTMARIEGRAS